jgi:hypothetical protein
MKITDFPVGTLLIGKDKITKGKHGLLLEVISKECPYKIKWLINKEIAVHFYMKDEFCEFCEESWDFYLP